MAFGLLFAYRCPEKQQQLPFFILKYLRFQDWFNDNHLTVTGYVIDLLLDA